MRLICGLLRLDGGAVSDGALRGMAMQMVADGLRPALRTWREGPVGLAVLDFAARDGAELPASGASILAADARLDESDKPASGLEILDDALLLSSLERHGPAGLGQLLGDFAFAAWDRETRMLTCGRDIFGVRPFSYTHQPGKLFAFASFGQAFLGAGLVAKVVDTDAVARRAARVLRADDSPIVGIQRLPAAHFLEVSGQGLKITRYWQLERASAGTRKISPDDAARELRSLVDEAVRCRLPRGVEVGAHLSGGLDSSAISVIAARRLREDGRPLHAYSFLDRQRNDIQLKDETEFVKAVLEQEGDIDWTPIRPPAGPPAPNKPVSADSMIALADDAPENQVCARAQTQGVSMILSGWGGDEGATFNGRGVLPELFLRARWPTLWREIAALSRERQWPWFGLFRGEVLGNLWRAALPRSVVNFGERRMGRENQLRDRFRQTVSPEARRSIRDEDGLSIGHDGRENRWRLMTSPHIAHRAEVWAQTGASYGLAYAFPLLDRRVVEFSLSLPSELFVRGGFKRLVFRDAMTGVLPESVRLRHAKYAPFPSSMLILAERKDEFAAQIDALKANTRVSQVLDLEYLRTLIDDFPSPDQARREMHGNEHPKAAASMIAVASALGTAAYLEQHGGAA